MITSARVFSITSSATSSSKATSGSAFVSASIEERYKQRADMSTNNLRRQKVSTWIS